MENVSTNRKIVDGFTIDGDGAQVLDDAIWVELKENGHWLVLVSIADPTEKIISGSALDEKAFFAAETHYLADTVKPMLPEKLVTDDLSLIEGQKRQTITYTIELDASLQLVSFNLSQTYLINKKQFTYQEIEAAAQKQAHPLGIKLELYYRLADLLLQKRLQGGVLAIRDIETGVRTTEEGKLVALEVSERYRSGLIIQELMTLANQVAATYMAENDICLLFRNHSSKAVAADSEKILHEDILQALSFPHLFNIKFLQDKIALSVNSATYGPELQGHFALKAPAYTRATSPLRRYADLVNLRIMVAFLNGEKSPYTKEKLSKIANYLNFVETWRKKQARRQLENAVNQTISRKIDTYHLSQLSPFEFHRYVAAITRDDLDEENKALVIEEITARIKKATLTANDVYLIIFRNHQSWQNEPGIWRGLIEMLGSNPQIAPAILEKVTHGQHAPCFDVRPSADGRFHIKVTIEIECELIVVEKIYAHVKDGKLAVTRDLLIRLIERQVNFVPDYTNQLYNLRKKSGRSAPRYKDIPGITDGISVEVFIKEDGRTISATGRGKTRDEAKSAASQNLLSQYSRVELLGTLFG